MRARAASSERVPSVWRSGDSSHGVSPIACFSVCRPNILAAVSLVSMNRPPSSSITLKVALLNSDR